MPFSKAGRVQSVPLPQIRGLCGNSDIFKLPLTAFKTKAQTTGPCAFVFVLMYLFPICSLFYFVLFYFIVLQRFSRGKCIGKVFELVN